MAKNRLPLDTYDIVPEEQRAYLMNYGKHFNEKMCKFAVSQMRDNKGSRIEITPKDELVKKLKENGITIENDIMHDAVFVYAMVKADFLGSSIEDEKHALLYVKDLLDDSDQSDGFVFNRWYADAVNSGIPIDWAEML